MGARGKPRILVVDDVVDLADTLAMILELEDFQVQTAYSGETALATADTFAPDAVVLDLNMPVMDGYDVAKKLRGTEPGRMMLLVALSALPPLMAATHAHAASFDWYLQKPAEPVAIAAFLRRAIGSRSPTQAR